MVSILGNKLLKMRLKKVIFETHTHYEDQAFDDREDCLIVFRKQY